MYWGKKDKVAVAAMALVFLFIFSSAVAYADIAYPDPRPLRSIRADHASLSLYWPTLLTVAIEVPLFYLLGYRRTRDCVYFAGVNIITNLLLNEFLQTVSYGGVVHLFVMVLLGECVVIALEFAALCIYVFPTEKKRFLITVLLTNLASFLVGIACLGFPV